MSRRDKKPALGVLPPESSAGRRPRTEFRDPSGTQQTPYWLVGKMDLDGPFGWHQHERETLMEVHRRLAAVETTTWSDLERGGSHHVDVDSLDKAARDRLADLQLDVEELFSLRLTGKKRVWGIREGRVLRVLWWDPEHQVCPSEKKHT